MQTQLRSTRGKARLAINPRRMQFVTLFTLVFATAICPHQASGQTTEVTRTGQVITAPPDVATPPRDAETTPSGLAMKVLRAGTGTEHPVANDCVTANFVAWTTDGSLFSTSTSMDNSELLCLNAAIIGVSEALKEMVVGEKRRLWVPEDLTFREHHHHGQKRPEDEVPPRGDLTFDLELLSIIKAPPTPADVTQPPATATRTSSGLAYQVVKSATSSVHPSLKDKVTVHFSCWRADGSLFESTEMGNHPALVTLATAPVGWREALPLMVVGQKARFWIPAALAFGDKPANRFNPAGDLVYEIELLGIQ